VASETPLFEYSRHGFRFEVHPGRIEIVEGAWIKKASTVLTRSITSVSVEGIGKAYLRVQTTGKRHDWMLGRDSEKARLAILSTIE
jgi:hypothetical protein